MRGISGGFAGAAAPLDVTSIRLTNAAANPVTRIFVFIGGILALSLLLSLLRRMPTGALELSSRQIRHIRRSHYGWNRDPHRGQGANQFPANHRRRCQQELSPALICFAEDWMPVIKSIE